MGRMAAAIFVAASVVTHVQAQAPEWMRLSDAEISEALTERSLTYANGATQHFYASGRTRYTHGEPSWGRWRADGDQYCSQWPPSSHWDCYNLEFDGGSGFNFVDPRGTPFFGNYIE